MNANLAFAFDQFTGAGSVENLFNDDSVNYVHPDAFIDGRYGRLRPRTVGVRIGYARIAANEGAKDEMLVGGTLGVELYKTKFFRFDAQTRLMGLFGNKDVGGHFGVQSGLQMHVAF